MSTILNALRKAQAEQKVPPVSAGSPAEPLLTQRPQRLAPVSHKRAVLIGSCGCILLLAVAWFLYGSPAKKQKPTMTAAPQAAPQPVSPAPQPPPAIASPVPATVAAPPVVTPQPTTAPPAPPLVAPKPAQPPVPADEEAADEGRSRRRRAVQGAKTKEPAPQSTPTAQTAVASAPEGVKLTGIAWQTNRTLSRAVINDNLVGEGVVINGAKLVEIKPTLVRFEKGGTLYEVSLPR